MMPKKLAMPLMIALRMFAIPLTTAMMQAPMVWKRDLICCLRQQAREAKVFERTSTYAGYDGTHFEAVARRDLRPICVLIGIGLIEKGIQNV
jgi:hypothetical protein